MRKLIVVSIFSLLVFVLLPLGSAHAMSFKFSDAASDDDLIFTDPSLLTAEVSFAVSDSQLTITIDNTSQYSIGQLYFNSGEDLTGLAFNSAGATDPKWSISGTGGSQGQHADSFGEFNWLIDFGSGSHRPGDGTSTTLVLTMAGTTTEAGIFNTLSSIPPGDSQVYAVIKFEAGPKDDSAYGAVPDASIALLLGTSLIVLGVLGRISSKKES